MGGKGKKKRNSKDSSSSNNGNGEEGEKKKDAKKKSNSSKSLGCDIFNDVAMENAYYVCHNVQVNIHIRVRPDKHLASAHDCATIAREIYYSVEKSRRW